MSEATVALVRPRNEACEGADIEDRAQRVRRTQSRFLMHLASSGNVSASARQAGVERSTVYGWREADRAFASAWEAALEDAVDLLEAEARRRAVDGYDEVVLSGGRIVCDPSGVPVTRRKYSDGLLSFLLRAHRPARFRNVDPADKGSMITITISPDDSVL